LARPIPVGLAEVVVLSIHDGMVMPQQLKGTQSMKFQMIFAVAIATTSGAFDAAPAVAHAGHAPSAVAAPVAAKKATFFYAQVYDVKEGKLDAFKQWFKVEGGPALAAYPGVATVETFVDDISAGPEYVTLIGFTDYAAYDHWDRDGVIGKVLAPLDDMVGPHKHYLFSYNPLHRSPSLSWPITAPSR
jgi:hypothetical protein